MLRIEDVSIIGNFHVYIELHTDNDNDNGVTSAQKWSLQGKRLFEIGDARWPSLI